MGEGILYAFGLCGIRRTALTQQHFADARMAANLVTGRWSADGVNLWQVQLGCITLCQGQATYQLPTNIIVMLDTYYTINSGTTEIDRIMMPISRSEYAAYSNKASQGTPTTYWMDRLLQPTVTLYLTPNGQQSQLKYYYLRQTQDSNLTNGASVEMPYYFQDAFWNAVALRLAMIWAPDRAPMLKLAADESWGVASRQNQETANIYVTPMVGMYFR
jgi:hypothetical protein